MSPPIRNGSGSSIGSIRLGDGTEISEVRTGAGDVLFSGNTIPNSVISRYKFEGDFTDSRNNNDGSGINSPTFTTTAAVGSQAVSLDSSNNESVDLPNYPNSFFDTGSVAVRVDPSQGGYLIWFGTDSTGQSRALQLTSNQYKFVGFGADFNTNVSPNSGYNLITIRWDTANGTAAVFRNDANRIGSGSGLTFNTPSSQENAFGERQSDNSFHVISLLDDARTYDKPLTSTEISNLFNNGRIDA